MCMTACVCKIQFCLDLNIFRMVKNFETNLIKHGFRYSKYEKGYYEIQHLYRIQPPIRIQHLASKPINRTIHGSQNGLKLDGIGVYHFSLTNNLWNPEYLIFSVSNVKKQIYDYMIIPSEELMRRLKKNMIRYRCGENLELRLWLIDGHLYDTTNLGVEGEWYYLTKGRGGRMIDGTIWNYTRFWNQWILESRE